MPMSREEKAQFEAMMQQLTTLQNEKAMLQAALAAKGTVSKLDDPKYRELCKSVKTELEALCITKGVTLAHVFTISDKVLPTYEHPVTKQRWSSRGKVPAWLKGHEEEYRLTNGAAH